MEEKVIIVKQGGSFGAFVRGAIIGAALALLLAPRSGEETREILTERGAEMYDKARYIAQDTRDRASTLVNDARNKVEETVKGVKQIGEEKTKDLKRELEIMEDVNNPIHPL
jgi:gas vesicle protein